MREHRVCVKKNLLDMEYTWTKWGLGSTIFRKGGVRIVRLFHRGGVFSSSGFFFITLRITKGCLDYFFLIFSIGQKFKILFAATIDSICFNNCLKIKGGWNNWIGANSKVVVRFESNWVFRGCEFFPVVILINRYNRKLL